MKDYFWGYPRSDGSYGVRNHIAVISSSDNANFIARRIASLVKGVIPICTSFGRGEVGKGLEQHVRTLGGMGLNPNVHSVIVVALEPVIASRVADFIKPSGKRVEILTFDDHGSTVDVTYKGVKLAQQMSIDASLVKRDKADLSNLVLGLKCGGSDTTSGIISNPATGLASDKLVDFGGTVILSETFEWMGAEHYLAKRAISKDISEEIINSVKSYEQFYKNLGIDSKDRNPSDDNRKGGLTTIEEKSLGAIKKAGTQSINAIYKYAERPDKNGLVLMNGNTPGVESITGLAGAGCQLIIFSTGKGNPIGNPLVPTIKVSGNPRTTSQIPENIDVDISNVITQGVTLDKAGEVLFDELITHANGKLTTSETLDDVEVSVSRIGEFVYG